MSTIGFVDDINLLAYGRSTEQNCQTLSTAHNICMRWANTHGATFAPQKYELMHLSRTPRRFNMTATVDIQSNIIEPKPNIRVLGVQVDSKLRWGAHLARIEAKADEFVGMGPIRHHIYRN